MDRPKNLPSLPPAYMIAVAAAGWGITRTELAEKIGVHYGSLTSWASGHQPSPKQRAAIAEVYLSAPMRTQIEALGLHSQKNFSAVLRILLRKLRLSVPELAAMVGLSSRSASAHLCEENRDVRPEFLLRASELCEQHSIDREDIERELREPFVFRKRQPRPAVNTQHVFLADSPDMTIREILHRAQADTRQKFHEMADGCDVSKDYFYHFTRPGGQTPNTETQKAVFAYLRDAYSETARPFPLIWKEA